MRASSGGDRSIANPDVESTDDEAVNEMQAPAAGTQFTCFTRTNVQILTSEELRLQTTRPSTKCKRSKH